jgi:excisionase family DNA binding protein
MNHYSLRASSILLVGAALAASPAAQAQKTGTGEVVAADGLPIEAPDVLIPDEAAVLLRVDQATLLDLARTGQVPARQVGDQWRFSRAALLGWLAGYRQGLALVHAGGAMSEPLAALRPLTARAATTVVGRGMSAAAQADQPVISPQSTEPDATIGAAPKGRTASEVFLRDQRIVLAPNEVTLDFGLLYARNDSLALVDPGNGPTLGSVESDTFGGVLVGRYSVGRATEMFASTSYRNQQVAIFADGQSLSRASRHDIGDIGLGLRHTIIDEGPGRPDVIVTLEGSIPTGASSYTLGGGLTLVKSFDPAVLFGSIDYRHSFSRDFVDITRLQPRDRIDAQIGYAFALNDTVILNTALSGSFNFATTFDDAAFRQNETFNLLLGLTARVSRDLFVQPSVSYRLNGLGSGVVFGLNFPYTFGL